MLAKIAVSLGCFRTYQLPSQLSGCENHFGAESFCSCSHGAGRKMSRSKAKKLFDADDLAEQTGGVECRNVYQHR